MNVISSDELIYPLFSDEVHTFILPILNNKNLLRQPIKLADGWRYFEDIVVLQKKKDFIYKKIIKLTDFIKLSQNCTKSQKKVEEIYHNLISKKISNIGLDFSKCNLMSVLNFTPDSFFSNSRIDDVKFLNQKINEFKYQNVDIIDIGAESSRPGAKKIAPVDEIERLKLFFENINIKKLNLKISLDSRNFETITSFLDHGVLIINDISGLKDNKFINLLLNENISIIIMHMQNNPEIMQNNPTYEFPVIDIYNFFRDKINLLLKKGVKKSQIIIDPGFGFGKNLNHNLNLFNFLPLFHSLGYPICVGLSRKSLIQNIYEKKFNSKISVNQRLAGSISLQNIAYLNGVQILRTHDIFEAQQSLSCLEEVYI